MNSLHPVFSDIIRPVRPFINAFQIAFQKEFESIKTTYGLDFDTRHFNKGKHLRPVLFFLCQGLINKPKKNTVDVAVMLELIHTASLIHDDVIDKSHKRRGQKSLNAALGNHFSVLVGDYMIARMMMMGSSRENGYIMHLSNAIMHMIRSELEQAIYEKTGHIEEENYFSIINGKTGALFEAAGALAGYATGALENQIQQLRRFGHHFGLAFQIKDDLLDFTGSSTKMGKPVYQDIQGGRWTLPMIRAFHELPERDQQYFQQQVMADEVSQDELIQMIYNQRGIEKTLSDLDECSQKARQAVLDFPESKYRFALQRMIDYNKDRHS